MLNVSSEYGNRSTGAQHTGMLEYDWFRTDLYRLCR
jgi:hypothetical protein